MPRGKRTSAIMKMRPTLISVIFSEIVLPKSSTESPKGISIKTAKATKTEMHGASQ